MSNSFESEPFENGLSLRRATRCTVSVCAKESEDVAARAAVDEEADEEEEDAEEKDEDAAEDAASESTALAVAAFYT